MDEKRILRLVDDSESRVFIPTDAVDHEELANAAQRCRGCDLYKHATQAVFGEGPTPARIMMIGEQPGDVEDRSGRPFVGPAGRILEETLEEAEIDRDDIYLTNAVKHFKWEPRGQRRLHARPNVSEVHACAGWLEAEIKIVQPEVIVCLGSTAAQLFFGRTFRLTKHRGELRDGAPWATNILATYHPSAILRMKRDEVEYARARRAFTLDLAEASSVLHVRRRRSAGRVARVAVAP